MPCNGTSTGDRSWPAGQRPPSGCGPGHERTRRSSESASLRSSSCRPRRWSAPPSSAASRRRPWPSSGRRNRRTGSRLDEGQRAKVADRKNPRLDAGSQRLQLDLVQSMNRRVLERERVHPGVEGVIYEAVENPMHVHDLHATILHLLGLDHERLTYRYAGRDMRLTDV